jgi:hypothetical protein
LFAFQTYQLRLAFVKIWAAAYRFKVPINGIMSNTLPLLGSNRQ